MHQAHSMFGLFSWHSQGLRCFRVRNILESGSVMSDHTAKPSIWRDAAFRAYLGSTGFSGMALAMQQLLLSWILIGILELPADQVGLIQAVIGLPGVLLMLAGGASADRNDARQMLIRIYLVAPIFPLFLVLMEQWRLLGVASVITWGLGITVVQSYSMPGQQALLNRIAGQNIQQGVTALPRWALLCR